MIDKETPIELSLEEFDVPFQFYMSLRRYCKLHEQLRSKIGRTVGLTDAQYYLLRVLASNASLSYTQLAEATGLSHNNVSTLIKGLIKSGYVKQSPCEDDGRITFLSLDGKGQQMMRRTYKSDSQTADVIRQVVMLIQASGLVEKLDELHSLGKDILAQSLTFE